MPARFAWDPIKAAANRRKHGVSFEVALRAFADPFALSEQDRVEGNEARWRTIGLVAGQLLLVVAHTVTEDKEGGEVIRIISARKSEHRERHRYEQEPR